MVSTTAIIDTLITSAANLDDTAVHEIRKATKQLRARLALQRAFEGSRPDTENLRQSVKQLARMLCEQRNRFVMDAALNEMAEETDEPELARLLNALRLNLDREPLTTGEIQQAQELVRQIATDAPKLMAADFDAQQLNLFLQTGLAQVTEIGPGLLAGQDFEALHEWRKQVKTLMYQYQLLPFPSSRDLQVMEKLEQLGSCLGNINDLHMLNIFAAEQLQVNAEEMQNPFAPVLPLFDSKCSQELGDATKLFEELRVLAG